MLAPLECLRFSIHLVFCNEKWVHFLHDLIFSKSSFFFFSLKKNPCKCFLICNFLWSYCVPLLYFKSYTCVCVLGFRFILWYICENPMYRVLITCELRIIHGGTILRVFSWLLFVLSGFDGVYRCLNLLAFGVLSDFILELNCRVWFYANSVVHEV